MRVLVSGHRYALARLDTWGDASPQVLQFVSRIGPKYPGNLSVFPGTTTQEVLRALIDRTAYVNAQQPCVENDLVRTLLEAALTTLEQRAKRVRDEDLRATTCRAVATAATCAVCGHVECTAHDPPP